MPSEFFSSDEVVVERRAFSDSRELCSAREEALRAEARVRRELVSVAWVVEEDSRSVAVVVDGDGDVGAWGPGAGVGWRAWAVVVVVGVEVEVEVGLWRLRRVVTEGLSIGGFRRSRAEEERLLGSEGREGGGFSSPRRSSSVEESEKVPLSCWPSS